MTRRVDIALTVLLSIGAIAVALGPDGGGPLAVALAPAATLPLLWWRSAPLLAAVALTAGSIVSAVPTFMQTRCGAMIPAALLIAFSVASRSDRRDAVAGLAALLFALGVLLVTDPLLDTGALFVPALCGALWGAGRVVRARTRLARELRARATDLAGRRAEVARLRLEVERSRLGRDIDAATRGRLRAIVAGARRAVDLDVPGRQAAFAEIERTARASLHEMRAVLGTLRADVGTVSAAASTPAPPAAKAPVMSALVCAATLACAAAVVAIAALGVDVGEGGAAGALVAVAALAYACGAHARPAPGLAATVALLAALELATTSATVVPGLLCVPGPWLAGRLVRSGRVLVEQLAQRTRELQSAEDALAALTVEHERARVARELHDIVAHHLAVVVLHAGAGRLAATVQPERAAARLDAIRTSAEEAIEELGRLVGLAELDHRGDRLPALLDDARSAGLEVTAETPGLDVLLPARVAEDTYRIVREGLTNALKHAPGSAVHVTVRVVADAVRIEIHDSDARRTAARPALSATGSGLGLLGMRERVTAAGGALAAGPDGDGGWSLEASLPISPLAAASADTPPRGPEVRRSG